MGRLALPNTAFHYLFSTFIGYLACLMSQQVYSLRHSLLSSAPQGWGRVGNGDGARFGTGRILCVAENAHPPAIFFSGRPAVWRRCISQARSRSRAVYGPEPGLGCLACPPPPVPATARHTRAMDQPPANDQRGHGAAMRDARSCMGPDADDAW